MAAPVVNVSELKTAASEPSESRFQVHNFSDTILNILVHFHVIKMKDSFFVWIGSGNNARFDNLAVAVKTKFVSRLFQLVQMQDHVAVL